MEIFREGWQWASDQMIKFWWQSGSPSGYRDCFPDSSLLGDTESGINQLTALCDAAVQGRHRHDNYDVITLLANDRRAWRRYALAQCFLLEIAIERLNSQERTDKNHTYTNIAKPQTTVVAVPTPSPIRTGMGHRVGRLNLLPSVGR